MTRPRIRASETVVVAVRLGRLLGVSAVAAAIRVRRGKTDSTPVKMCGAALGKSKLFARFRIAVMTQSGMSTVCLSGFVLRGVLLPLIGVLGVLCADAAAAVALLLGVCGSRDVSDVGSALLR
jgi:hypothetical protein